MNNSMCRIRPQETVVSHHIFLSIEIRKWKFVDIWSYYSWEIFTTLIFSRIRELNTVPNHDIVSIQFSIDIGLLCLSNTKINRKSMYQMPFVMCKKYFRSNYVSFFVIRKVAVINFIDWKNKPRPDVPKIRYFYLYVLRCLGEIRNKCMRNHSWQTVKLVTMHSSPKTVLSFLQ